MRHSTWEDDEDPPLRRDETEVLRQQVAELQRQLEEVTRERDYYKQALQLADALRNNAHAATLDRREWRRK